MKSDVTEFFKNSSSLTPESLLWLSVIVQAIHDARIDFNDVKIYEAPNSRFKYKFRVTDADGYLLSQPRLKKFYECLDARLWFERQLEDFELVCAMSGMDQSYVFRIYNKVMADDDIDPVAMLKQFMKY